MITPDYLNEIIKGVENRLSDNNEYLIRHIAKHIGDSFDKREKNIIMPSTISNLHKLMDSGMVLDDIQKEVEKLLPDIKEEVRQAFLESASEIAKYETDFSKKIVQTLNNHGQPVDVEIPDYEKEGIPRSAKDLNMTAMEIRQLERIYRKTQETVSNLCHTIPSAGQTAYIDACERAYMKAQAGISPNTAIIEAIEEMAQEGIKVVNYDSGHVDKIEVAVARAVRSGINKANSEIVLTRCAEMGVGYVKVSAHLGARVTGTRDYRDHSYWQGKVYKLDFNNPELKKYVPTPQDEEQNRQDGFGWFDDVKKAIGNDTMFEESTLYSDEDSFMHEFSNRLEKLAEKIDNITKHEPVQYDDMQGIYKKNLENIVNNAPFIFKSFFNKYKSNIYFVNEKALGNSYYDVDEKGISINIIRDAINNYASSFHEIGHALDFANNQLSVFDMFNKALKDDYKEFAILYDKLYTKDMPIEYALETVRDDLLYNKKYRIVSDLAEGMYGVKYSGRWGHGKKYWEEDENNLVYEAFAHFFQISIQNDKEQIEIISQIFPNAYEIFIDLIKSRL